MAVAIGTKRWTLEEVHSLPDDGNKYELVRGQLFVTPAPRQYHQVIVNRMAAALMPFVAENRLGYVWQARSVVRAGGALRLHAPPGPAREARALRG